MNAEVRHLFGTVVRLSESERRRVLDDPALAPDVRAEVESLLAFDADGDHGITSAVAGAATDFLRDGVPSVADGWGPYRPLRLIGTGGMSAVYLAERADGEVRQRVAVKVLRGGIGAAAVERFLRERQVLASLNHPGIARLIDAGRGRAGDPYLVMDLVEGVPIDEYADSVGIPARLRLFGRVCDAVAYAHRHLVIHRDIKPSNILVDVDGQPKLLDFGIAKLLDTPTSPTQPADRWLTPNYASPEQRRGEADTTATDVYSLGAVLYRLLTGHPPREDGVGAAPVATAPDLPADAWFILRKAMRPEPAERYASAEALARDIEAVLDRRPVDARAGDRWYRTRRLLARHRAAVATAALAVAALAAGLFVVNRERAVAERRFALVRQLANQVLTLDATLRDVPGTTAARQQVVDLSQRYLGALSSEAGGDPALALELASASLKVARAQGVPTQTNLGKHDEAKASLVAAESLLTIAVRALPSDPSVHLARAEVSHDRMILADAERDDAGALSHALASAAHIDAFLALAPGLHEARTVVGKLLLNIALMHKNLHRLDDCMRLAGRALEILGPQGDRAARANTLSVVADARRLSGDLSGALEAITDARAMVSADVAAGVISVVNRYNVLWREGVILGGDGQISMERPAEAVAVLQEAFDLMEGLARRDTSDALSRIRMATTARELGSILQPRDPARALRTFDHTIGRLREVVGNVRARRAEADLLARSAGTLRRLDRRGEATRRLDTALALLRQANAYPTSRIAPGEEVATVLRAHAEHLAATDRVLEATQVYRNLLDAVLASRPDPTNDLSHAIALSHLYAALGGLYAQLGDGPSARPLGAARLDIWQAWSGRLPHNPYVQQQLAAAQLH